VRATTGSVWDELRERLSAWLHRQVRDPHLSEDLLQETFVRVHNRLPDLEAEERIAPWVFRIASKLVREHHRAARSLVPLAEPDPEVPEPTDELESQVGEWLRRMLTLLPDEQREALEAVEVQGLTQRELAERLGLSLSAVKSRVQRGRRRLQAELLSCCHFELDRRGRVIDYHRHGRCDSCGQSSGRKP
jgi:RNA polymerase sigma-70 factor (ECF subfamily)